MIIFVLVFIYVSTVASFHSIHFHSIGLKRKQTSITSSNREIFDRIKKEAEKFKDQKAKTSALKIVKRLETTSFSEWKALNEFNMIDSCLIEGDDAEDCEAFFSALVELRHFYEASAGNG